MMDFHLATGFPPIRLPISRGDVSIGSGVMEGGHDFEHHHRHSQPWTVREQRNL